MNQKLVKLMLTGLAVFIIALPLAQARGSKGHDGQGKGKSCAMKDGVESKFWHKAFMVTGNAEALGLSDKQLEDIQALTADVRKHSIKQEADIKIIDIDIESQLHERQVNLDAVNALIDKKYDLEKENDKYVIGALGKLKSGLTDDQYKSLKDLYKNKWGNKEEKEEKREGHEHGE